MRLSLSFLGFLSATFAFAQTTDSLKSKQIEAVSIIAKKPTVESKADRTVFNVANSSILAGNTTWDIVRMTPLVSIDNNDNVKAEGESVTVYINDRKSVFTGKELKEYLKTIPADNLMKIEVITSPSSRYEASGAVINIVLKKRDDEGLKGSISLTNSQNTKNNQYGSLNLNYHKKNFTQTFTGSYSDNVFITENSGRNTFYADHSVSEIDSKNTYTGKNPSFSSTSEFELSDKNNIGLVLEYFRGNGTSQSASLENNYRNDALLNSFSQDVLGRTISNKVGTNLFYKYYDKEKNRILDVNLGVNYDSEKGTTDFTRMNANNAVSELRHFENDNQNRNYFVKVDYTSPLGKGGSFEVGGKANFNNNVIPNDYLVITDNIPLANVNQFQYTENLNSLYANYSKTFFEKLETRIGLRYEFIDYKIHQNGTETRRESYGTFLPNLLVKYAFTPNYDLSLTYNHNLWRPWYSEFNDFEIPGSNGFFYRGNVNLLPNPSDRIGLKFGIYKKYFLSARYTFTDQDYWTSYTQETENGLVKTISFPDNFKGKVEKFYLSASTNQNLIKNKLNVNLSLGWAYTDNSDFNTRNRLEGANNYLNFFTGSTNLSYTNLFNKNINLSAWMSIDNQNYGNSVANQYNFFHNISVTKIFPVAQIETSLQLINIFKRPSMNTTTFSQIGSFQSTQKWDWYGFSLTFVKRFGNQKVKENSKTDVEKNSGGSK